MTRKKLILLIVLFVALVGVLFFWSYSRKGTLQVTAPQQTPNSSPVAVQILQPDTKAVEFSLKPGQTKKVRLSPGNVQINGSVGDQKSVHVVTVQRRKTTAVTTPTGQQHAIEQIGLNARHCPAVLQDKVYSFNCRHDGPIVRHTATGGTAVFEGRLFSLLQPLQSGLLGFYTDDFATLRFVDLQGETVQSIPLPANIQQLLTDNIPKIITPKDPADGRFVLVFSQANKVYLFDGLNDQNPTHIQLAEAIDTNEEGRLTSFSLSTDGLTVYAGSDSHTHDGDEAREGTEEPELESFLFEYTNSGELVKTLPLGHGFDAQGLYKIADNYYLAERMDTFEFYFLGPSGLAPIYKINDIGGWVTFQNKTYIQEKSTLYLFTPISDGAFALESRFTASQLPVSAVYGSVRGLIFTGFAGTTSTAPLNIYRLLDMPAQPGAPLPGAIVTKPIEFIGIEDVLNFGVTSVQLDALKKAFSNYTQTLSGSVNKITVANSTAVPRDRNSASTTDTITFDVFIDDTHLKGKVEYADLTTIRLYLSDLNGNAVFDSQPISN